MHMHYAETNVFITSATKKFNNKLNRASIQCLPPLPHVVFLKYNPVNTQSYLKTKVLQKKQTKNKVLQRQGSYNWQVFAKSLSSQVTLGAVVEFYISLKVKVSTHLTKSYTFFYCAH